jgi:hypothetical protein
VGQIGKKWGDFRLKNNVWRFLATLAVLQHNGGVQGICTLDVGLASDSGI